jgi:hypothetical protein
MKRILAVVVACLVVFLLFPCAAMAQEKAVRRTNQDSFSSQKDQKRVALVIGNSDYKVGPLRNPAHDAEDFSGVLRTLGFAVQTKTNVNQREMEEAVNKFVQEIQNGDVALFYFSGHGVQVRGENYLIPLGDPIQMEADVRFKTLNAGLVLAKMEESRNRANIVILDACRNNPFRSLFRSPSMGLSKMDAPKGTFIAYATSPDSVAADGTERNSPYTKHLMEALKIKGIPIEQAFKQVARAVNKETGGQQTPWILSSLLDDFYFNLSSPTTLQQASLPPTMSPEPGRAGQEFFRSQEYGFSMEYPKGWTRIDKPKGNYYVIFEAPELTEGFRNRIHVAAHKPVKDPLDVYLQELRKGIKDLQKKDGEKEKQAVRLVDEGEFKGGVSGAHYFLTQAFESNLKIWMDIMIVYYKDKDTLLRISCLCPSKAMPKMQSTFNYVLGSVALPPKASPLWGKQR